MKPRRLTLLCAVAATCIGATPERADLLIRGGTIYSGSGAPFVGDVTVVGDRIDTVARGATVSAARVIDARGMISRPGSSIRTRIWANSSRPTTRRRG